MKMKKLLSAILAVAMLMSMIVLPVSAEENMETFSVGETKTVVLEPGSEANFQFTAPETGCYILCTSTRSNFVYHFWNLADTVSVGVGGWNGSEGNLHGPVMQVEAGKVYGIHIADHEENGLAADFTLVKAHNFSSLELERTQVVGYVGDDTWLSVMPSNEFIFEPLIWSSSNEDVAVIVYSSGTSAEIGFNGVGTTTITASTASGLTATCEVTVKEMETITGDSFDVSLAADGFVEYRFTPAEDGRYLFYYPSRGHGIGFELRDFDTGRYLYPTSWRNADNSLRGNFYTLTGGVEYRVRTYNWWGDQAQSCTIGITTLVPFESIWLNGDTTCYVGSEVHVTVVGSPEFSTGNIEWTISDTNVVSENFADDSGITLNGLSVGTATVTATTDNGLSASFEVTVVDMPTIEGDSFTVELPVDGNLVYKFVPTETGNYLFYYNSRSNGVGFDMSGTNDWIESLEWQSADGSLRGRVFALTAGEQCAVQINNWWSEPQTCNISIVKTVPYTNLYFRGNESYYLGENITLQLVGDPQFSFEAITDWDNTNPEVAAITWARGGIINLSALSLGTTTVTATTETGKTASFTLTVKEMETITGNSFDVTIPAEGNAQYLFTPSEDGSYLFYLPNGIWSIGFDMHNQETDNWVDSGDWENPNSGDHGAVFKLSKDVTYLVTVYNWQTYQQSFTVSITETVPYDNMWIEGGNVCYVDSDLYLRVYGEPAFAAESVQWTVSNPDVVQVRGSNSSGISLLGIAAGSTTVTATTESGKSASITLEVKEMPKLGTEPTDVTIPAGESMQLAFTPTESGNYIVYISTSANCGLSFWNMDAGEWYSDDGRYYGRAAQLTAGQTALVRVNNWRDFDQNVIVTAVKAVPYEHIAFREAPLGFVGENSYVAITGGPGFAYEPIQWSSSNPAVASVDYNNGTSANIVGLAVGTTTITATTASGVSVSYEMTVQEKAVLKAGETTLLTIPQDTYTKALFTPAETGTYIFEYPANTHFDINCYDSNWNWPNGSEWASSDGSRRGRSFTMQGGTTYTLEVYNWNVQGVAEMELTVTKAVPYTKLAFTQNSYVGYASKFQRTPVYIDYAPEYGGEELIITSSNPEVAAYSWFAGDCIYLHAKSTGTATITVSTVDGRLTDTCTVTIEEPVALENGDEKTVTLDAGAYVLYEFVAPADGKYTFYCMDNMYFGWSVFYANGEWVQSNDRWMNNAFTATFDAVAGTTYYIPFNNYGEEKNTFELGIGQMTEATGMELIGFADDVTVYPKLHITLNPVFTPVLAEPELVTWTIGDESIIKYSRTNEYEDGSYGYDFYSLSAGTTTITATTASGLKASCEITITASDEIGLGTHSVDLTGWDLVVYEFTAPGTGTYVISDQNTDSFVGWIVDLEKDEFFNEGATQKPVKIMLEAGQTVYPFVSNNIDEDKTFTITIEQGVHEHEPVYVAEKAPTYAEDGMKEHYACICGNLYADAKGTTEVTAEDLLIPKLIQIEDNKTEISTEIIGGAVEEVENGGEVKIPVADAGEVISAAVPVEALTQIIEKEASLTLEMTTASVTIDSAALATVVEKVGTDAVVTLEVEKIPEEDLTETQMAAIEELDKNLVATISAELLVNDQPIGSAADGGFGGGKVTVKIPVVLATDDFTVVYIADDGSVTVIENATYENGILTMELEHFSTYAIVQACLPGDTNDDGKITILDLMRLANFFAGKDVELNQANADVNGDGKVTILDLMRLANYFAGKDVTLGKP